MIAFGLSQSKLLRRDALPVPFPLPTDRVSERRAKRAMRESAVVEAAMIFKPCRMSGILVKVASADVMVLASDHPAKPREIRLRKVGRNPEVRVSLAVINPKRRE